MTIRSFTYALFIALAVGGALWGPSLSEELKEPPGRAPGRGQAVTICIPSAGQLDGLPAMMGVLLLSDEVHINEWEMSAGDALTVHVGGEFSAFMERIGSDGGHAVLVIASKHNRGNVRLGWQHALEGEGHKWLKPGELLEVNPSIARRWTFTATRWGGTQKDNSPSRGRP